jgi:hypothetical protein
MKRIISICLLSSLIICLFGTTPIAQATTGTKPVIVSQSVGGYCCDAYLVRRCIINMSLIGTPCFCMGQGWGHVCF